MPTNLYYLVSGDVSEQGGGQRLMTKLDPPLSPLHPSFVTQCCCLLQLLISIECFHGHWFYGLQLQWRVKLDFLSLPTI